MSNKLPFDKEINKIYDYIFSESQIKSQIIFEPCFFFSCIILIIPKVVLLIIINFFSNLGLNQLQNILFNTFCYFDLIILFFCFFVVIFLNKEEITQENKIITFFKFYFLNSGNLILFLYFYIIPIMYYNTMVYSILICMLLFFSNFLIIHKIHKYTIFSCKDIAYNFIAYLILDVIFLYIAETKNYYIEGIKLIYYLCILYETINFTQVKNKIKLLESANDSLLNLFIINNNNLFGNTMVVRKDLGKFSKIYEKRLNDFVNPDESDNDKSLINLIISLTKIKEINKFNKSNYLAKNYTYYQKKKNIRKSSKNLLFIPHSNTKLERIVEQKEEDLNEANPNKKFILDSLKNTQKIIKLSSENEKINVVQEIKLNTSENKKINFNSECILLPEKKIDNSFDNMIEKNYYFPLDEERKNYKNIIISLVENYDYENIEIELRSFILEMFTKNNSIDFKELTYILINSKFINDINRLEIGPFNACIKIEPSKYSKSFLVSIKIQLLNYLKSINYIIFLRDLELISKIIEMNDSVNSKDEKPSLKKKLTSNYFEKQISINSNCDLIKSLSIIRKNAMSSFNHYDQSMVISEDTKRLNDPFIPALIHDFKNLSYDFTSLISLIIQKLPENYRIQFKDELDDIVMLKSYMSGLIKMLNEFSEGNGFLINSNPVEIDIIGIINLMIRIFTKRNETENIMKGENQMKKSLLIHSKIHLIEIDLLKNLTYNKDLILSLLYNIISNSFKLTQSGEILLELKTETIYNQNCIVLYISDTGSGIPENILQTWGKPFNKDSKDKNSSGLGQFIINSIANSLSIYIPKPESKINVGTTFRIYFTNNNNYMKSENILKINESPTISKITNLNNYYLDKNNFNESFAEYIVYILMCDDSQLCMSQLEGYLKNNLKSYDRIEFVIIKSSNFFEFLNEINLLLNIGQFFDIIILDYNIGSNITGINLANCAIDIYKNSIPGFNELEINIFFLTEEINFYDNFKFNFFVKKDHIFNKSSFNKLLQKMIEKF